MTDIQYLQVKNWNVFNVTLKSVSVILFAADKLLNVYCVSSDTLLLTAVYHFRHSVKFRLGDSARFSK